MALDLTEKVFFELLRAGLWEKEVSLSGYGEIDYAAIMRMAEEQSAVGLITAGLEQVIDVKIPQAWTLQFIGSTLQIEQRNKAMNEFIGDLIQNLREIGVYTLLVKGQGIAQCYEKPLWRACGDVDLFLSNDNYNKAKEYLRSKSSYAGEENSLNMHLALTINECEVELHGTLRSGLWKRLDREIDQVQNDVFYGGSVRSWINGKTQVFLPGVNEDIIFVFTHILQHFYKEGIGLRQICDWCRLLWTYKDAINIEKLEKRLQSLGVVSEWKAFATLSVECLGIPVEAMPFYSPARKWSRKAKRIMKFVLETGNFGHKRDYSYQEKHSYLIYKAISLRRHTCDFFRYFTIFPMDAIKVWWNMLGLGLSYVVKGK